jgi:lipoyl(octanoyl) transferase
MMRRAEALLYDLPGLTQYSQALYWQRVLFNARTSTHPGVGSPPKHANVVLALEHLPVFTLGRSGQYRDLCFPGMPPSTSAAAGTGYDDGSVALPPPPPGFEVHRVERGGKVSYHGPGQLVVYPLLDLRDFKQDLHWYVESIEEVIIRALRVAGGVHSFRVKGSPGVWTGVEGSGRERKIAAVGMNSSKWFTQHGFSINVHPNLAHFDYIVPCGVQEKGRVTSLALECSGGGDGGAKSMEEFKTITLRMFSEVFQCNLNPSPIKDLPVGFTGAASPP